jgi:hypothetical protein
MKVEDVRVSNPKSKKIINAFLKADLKYNALVNSGMEESPQGESLYNRSLELWEELPESEQKSLAKQYKDYCGYDCIGA